MTYMDVTWNGSLVDDFQDVTFTGKISQSMGIQGFERQIIRGTSKASKGLFI